MSADCIFCEIISGHEPASFVHRDRDVVAFMTHAPVNPGHVLVIPVAHVRGLADLAGHTGPLLFATAQRIAAALRGSELRCDGINLFLADGESASQLVPHVHLHVIPRFAGDSFKLNPRGGVTSPQNVTSRAELDTAAQSIRAALAV